MNNGEHGGHAAMCAMNMLWNTQVVDTCIVFSSWHVRSPAHFVFSLLVIVLLGVLYEYLRVCQRALDARLARVLPATVATATPARRRSPPASRSSTPDTNEHSGLVNPRRARNPVLLVVPTYYRILRAVLYGASIFLSFFLMLVFMTYNAYIILAVVVGAVTGHYIFSAHVDLGAAEPKCMACH